MLTEYSFAQRLKDLREKACLSQSDVAARIGSHPSNVSNWELGYNRPNIDMIRNLCKLFGVSADFLLGLPGVELTDREARCLDMWRQLDDAGHDTVYTVLESQLRRLGRAE